MRIFRSYLRILVLAYRFNRGLTFESTAEEGAILTMPDGAYYQELGNLGKFRDYVAEHADNWYKFVNGPLGREAENGDIRVVTGCDKTISWGMATFSNFAQQSNFRLQFRPLEISTRPSVGSAYTWEHSGMADVRVGPDLDENDELGGTADHPLRNQCLFMRTLNVTLEDDVWAQINPSQVTQATGKTAGGTTRYTRPALASTGDQVQSSDTSPRYLANSVSGVFGLQSAFDFPGSSEEHLDDDKNEERRNDSTGVIIEHSLKGPVSFYTIL